MYFFFLDSTCKWYHKIFVFLWLTSLNIIFSGSIHVVPNGNISLDSVKIKDKIPYETTQVFIRLYPVDGWVDDVYEDCKGAFLRMRAYDTCFYYCGQVNLSKKFDSFVFINNKYTDADKNNCENARLYQLRLFNFLKLKFHIWAFKLTLEFSLLLKHNIKFKT